jgi:hypothetical protein
MPFFGIMWATIICVPFWLIVIKIGLAFSTIIFIDLALVGVGLLLLLPLTSKQITTIRFPSYEFKYIGDRVWQIVSEKKAMERLVDGFDAVTPAISRILKGEEIIVSNEIYRLLRT